MKRKVLTMTNNGVREDLIPYVDALAVVMDGSNLKETLAKIKEDIQRNKLFLGAFSTEETLLSSYPNGSTLEQGTYAIVTDVDAIYLYDVESLSWKKTATSSLAISIINGLTPVNGTLTITGGDINSNVPNADVPEQSITNHLNTLYDKADNVGVALNGTIAEDYGSLVTIVGEKITFNAQVYNGYKESDFIYMLLRKPSSITESDYEKNVEIKITYEDGETKTLSLYSADSQRLTYQNLVDYIGINNSISSGIFTLIKITGSNGILTNINKNSISRRVITTYMLNTSRWVDNEEGTGYKYVLTAGKTMYTGSYGVLGVYKENNGIKTTAIVDYTTQENIITIYSDEKFNGGVTISYIAG